VPGSFIQKPSPEIQELGFLLIILIIKQFQNSFGI
jgi:hypothetical protein